MLEKPSITNWTEQDLQSEMMLIFSYFFMCLKQTWTPKTVKKKWQQWTDNPPCWNNVIQTGTKFPFWLLIKKTSLLANLKLQIRQNVMLRWRLIGSIAHNVLTVPVCSQSMRACAVPVGNCALRLSLPSWLGWSSKASLRSSANWTTCSGPALTGEPRSYMLLENSTAAAFEPGEYVEEERRDNYSSQKDY